MNCSLLAPVNSMGALRPGGRALGEQEGGSPDLVCMALSWRFHGVLPPPDFNSGPARVTNQRLLESIMKKSTFIKLLFEKVNNLGGKKLPLPSCKKQNKTKKLCC